MEGFGQVFKECNLQGLKYLELIQQKIVWVSVKVITLYLCVGWGCWWSELESFKQLQILSEGY